MTTRYRYTIEDLERFPDDGTRREIIDGELFVTTAPHFRHQDVIAQLLVELELWNRLGDFGSVLPGTGVIFSRFDAVVPDLVWISRERFGAVFGDDGKLHAAPDLVVEVVSPGAENRRRDREVKPRLYDREGVREYWLVDYEARTIAVYRREGDRLVEAGVFGTDDRLTSPLLPGFELEVGRIFRRPPAGL